MKKRFKSLAVAASAMATAANTAFAGTAITVDEPSGVFYRHRRSNYKNIKFCNDSWSFACIHVPNLGWHGVDYFWRRQRKNRICA